jgi:intracellular multiplication protein IcmJ
MLLLSLILSVDPGAEAADDESRVGTDPAGGAHYFDNPCCAFCGARSGRWQRFVAGPRGEVHVATCPLCLLCCGLGRPGIDREAVLVWLPEMSQAALNVTVREIHVELRALGEDLHDAGRRRLDTPERRRSCHALAALSARTAAAAGRLDTDKPSELAGALYRLKPAAYANRAKLLGGVRLLPLGRFYDGGRDVYPEIVDAWRGTATPPASPQPNRAELRREG